MRYLYGIASVLFSIASLAQSPGLKKIISYREKNEVAIYKDFISFLSIPNVATDSANIGKNAVFLADLMKTKGISNINLLMADDRKTPLVVYGEFMVTGAEKTVVFYAHYDGQPVNPGLWAKGLSPFLPQLAGGRIDENSLIQSIPDFPLKDNWRIYARGASDDKGGIMAILTAFSAIRESGLSFPYNIKFFFEGEEEQGSTHLAQILSKYQSLLQSDLWIICDGPVHQSGNKQIVFGARGDAHLTLKVFGPKYPLHSGHYGNWAPNPVMMLAKLLASMKDDNGRVAIKDFYNDVRPLTPSEKKAIAEIPDVDETLKEKIGFASEEIEGVKLKEAINLPSLNINGIESSNAGTIQANIIPVSATAVIDLRLVMGNDWRKQQQKVIDHIAKMGFYITDSEPSDAERKKYKKIIHVKRGEGYNAVRTSMDWPVAGKIISALREVTGKTVLRVPTMGGSLPLEALGNTLHARFLIVPIANPDNNQHGENENIRIGNFYDGIDMMASIMMTNL
jgi:acetylornithine deacetylase/succinyl-diaminopimelate desuccinylase-like protein